MFDAAAIGELLIDLTETAKDSMGYPTYCAHPGGAPANFLAAISRFGGKTAFIGKVGKDDFGRLLKNTLKDFHINTDAVAEDENVFTTLAFVNLREDGERSFSFSRKPGADTRLTWEEIDCSVIENAKLLHFGTLSLTNEPARSAVKMSVEYAKKLGKLLSFDPNLREPLWQSLKEAKEQMEYGFRRADIVKLSEEEAEFMWGLAPEASARKLTEEYGVKLAFVTCGAKGAYFRNAQAGGHVRALSGLAVKDTTGAGDIFGGSAVWMLLKNDIAPEKLSCDELYEITSFASVSAGLSTLRSGGISSVPEYDEIMEILRRN